MKHAVLTALTLLCAVSAVAGLTPGAIVATGAPFPIIADFNGDGLADLVQEKGALLSNGNAPATAVDFGLPQLERVVAALDVNGDRILDVVTEKSTPSVPAQFAPSQTPSPNSYRLYIVDRSFRLGKATNLNTALKPNVADADGDGRDDLILMYPYRSDGKLETGTDMVVLRSRGDGSFEPLPALRLPPLVQLYSDHRVPSADINHDGLPDLVFRTVEEMVVLRGTGGGAFAVESRYMPRHEKFGGWGLRLGDVDGDGNADVVLAGLRQIRVLFGDGRGRFPRSTTAAIAKLHDAEGLPAGVPFGDLDRFIAPRNLAIGSFTRADRQEIAAGTMEGDLVIFAYEHGRLQEVSRTKTEFWSLDVRAGAFRDAAIDDVYVGGTLIWGDNWPRPRIFQNLDGGAAAPAARVAPGRRRAGAQAPATSELELSITGDCVSGGGAWAFAREGAFGTGKRGEMTVEALIDEGFLYFRLSAPFAQEAVRGVLTETDGVYRGSAEVDTACGRTVMSMTAKIN